MIDLNDPSWGCMVCGDLRPYNAISVAYRPVQGYEAEFNGGRPGSHRWNVSHCNDRPNCVAYATAEGPWPGSRKSVERLQAERDAAVAQIEKLGAWLLANVPGAAVAGVTQGRTEDPVDVAIRLLKMVQETVPPTAEVLRQIWESVSSMLVANGLLAKGTQSNPQ